MTDLSEGIAILEHQSTKPLHTRYMFCSGVNVTDAKFMQIITLAGPELKYIYANFPNNAKSPLTLKRLLVEVSIQEICIKWSLSKEVDLFKNEQPVLLPHLKILEFDIVNKSVKFDTLLRTLIYLCPNLELFQGSNYHGLQSVVEDWFFNKVVIEAAFPQQCRKIQEFSLGMKAKKYDNYTLERLMCANFPLKKLYLDVSANPVDATCLQNLITSLSTTLKEFNLTVDPYCENVFQLEACILTARKLEKLGTSGVSLPLDLIQGHLHNLNTLRMEHFNQETITMRTSHQQQQQQQFGYGLRNLELLNPFRLTTPITLFCTVQNLFPNLASFTISKQMGDGGLKDFLNKQMVNLSKFTVRESCSAGGADAVKVYKRKCRGAVFSPPIKF